MTVLTRRSRSKGASLSAYSVTRRVVKVAAGVFAPGHLGELTQHVPFEMVDAALAEAGPGKSRVRDVPARVVVYLLLAGALFADVGYRQVWDKLVAALDGVSVAKPSSGVLAQARQRMGPGPLRALFDLLRGPGPAPRTRGRWWRGLLVCAIDGTSAAVPASDANLAEYTAHRCNHGGSGYPKLRLLVLVCCGTRTVIDAVFGPTTIGEVPYAKLLVASLRSPMVVLLDRAFGAADLIEAVVKAKAYLVVRVKDNRKLPVIRRLPDGSYLSVIGPLCGADPRRDFPHRSSRWAGRPVVVVVDWHDPPGSRRCRLCQRGGGHAGPHPRVRRTAGLARTDRVLRPARGGRAVVASRPDPRAANRPDATAAGNRDHCMGHHGRGSCLAARRRRPPWRGSRGIGCRLGVQTLSDGNVHLARASGGPGNRRAR